MNKFWKTLKKVYIWIVLVTYPIVVAAMLTLLYWAFILLSASAVYPN